MASTLNISLPEHAADYVVTHVESEEFSTPSDFIAALIRNEMERQHELEERLLAALNDGDSITLTSDEVERGDIIGQLRQKMIDRQGRAA